MKKSTLFLKEIGIGLLICLPLAWMYASHHHSTESISLRAYDWYRTFRKPAPISNAIKIVEVDEQSVASLGRWPWPRPIVAALVDEIFDHGAKVIGVNVLFSEPAQNEGLEELERLYEEFSQLLDSKRAQFRQKNISQRPFDLFLADLEETRTNLDGDAILERSLDEAGNTVLSMYFTPGQSQGENLEALPEYLIEQQMPNPEQIPETMKIPSAIYFSPPLEIFGYSALAIGHSNLAAEIDGITRQMAPVMKYDGKVFPSFALQVIREYKSLPPEALVWKEGEGFNLGGFTIPVDSDGRTFLDFAGPAGTFERFSALDVLSGAVPKEALNGKLVLLGVSLTGTGNLPIVPGGETFTGTEIWATHIDNILSQRFITRPPWAPWAEMGMMVLSALLVLFVLPFVRARFSVPSAILLFGGMVGGTLTIFMKQGLWVSPAYGAVLLGAGFLVLTIRKLLFAEKGKELVEAEGVETNKMLGLSFQGQGMLDLAFEKFRKCPLDGAMKELLYNLGLDMERKRQFSKAAAVYEHIASDDAKYKDIQDKIQMLKKAGEGAVFGGIGKKGSDSTVVVEGLGQNTTLGRYEIQRELGRGAMGIVYLGKDPKINRQVAVKTLRFEDEVDEEQAKSIKERFFREAESAGNLTHPNIIRIFDAGEDQDVAYIAMELINGHDLKKYCDKGHLLPVSQVIDFMAHVADGLGYAHKQGVVHRDIKPGNIMLLDDGTLRITDFGIARIQATSKTSTGAVLGTPAYMSPEQVNGKKADGRADIFSLGVTFFELLTGEKPFAADSIAALLYRIANVVHPDPREFRPDVPEVLIHVINKALEKDPDHRYQTASEMSADLRNSLTHLKDDISPSIISPRSSDKSEEIRAPIKIEEKAAPPEAPPPPQEPPGKDNFMSELQDVLKSEKINEPPEVQVDIPIIEPNAFENEVEGEPEPSIAPAHSALIESFFGETGTPTEISEPKEEGFEKTVALDPQFSGSDIPLSDSIERTFQPPDPHQANGDNDDEEPPKLS